MLREGVTHLVTKNINTKGSSYSAEGDSNDCNGYGEFIKADDIWEITCEITIKLICGETKLKSHDFRLRGSLRTNLLCENCTEVEIEDPFHILIICAAYKVRREQFQVELCRDLGLQWDIYSELSEREKFKLLLGGENHSINVLGHEIIRVASCRYIGDVYYATIKGRE